MDFLYTLIDHLDPEIIKSFDIKILGKSANLNSLASHASECLSELTAMDNEELLQADHAPHCLIVLALINSLMPLREAPKDAVEFTQHLNRLVEHQASNQTRLQVYLLPEHGPGILAADGTKIISRLSRIAQERSFSS